MDDAVLGDAVDLFGLPLRAEKGAGRPAHLWTQEKSNVVNLLFACGRKPIEIARVLKISKPTFYKHYFNEIENAGLAPLMLKGRQLARLNAEAEKGNVAAEKALAAMVHAEQLRVLGDQVIARRPASSPAVPIGKKQAQAAAADGVTGQFAQRSPPPGLMIN